MKSINVLDPEALHLHTGSEFHFYLFHLIPDMIALDLLPLLSISSFIPLNLRSFCHYPLLQFLYHCLNAFSLTLYLLSIYSIPLLLCLSFFCLLSYLLTTVLNSLKSFLIHLFHQLYFFGLCSLSFRSILWATYHINAITNLFGSVMVGVMTFLIIFSSVFISFCMFFLFTVLNVTFGGCFLSL